MAEGLAKKLFPAHSFSSAGLFVNTGDSVSENSIIAIKDYDIDISLHKPTQLTIEHIKNNDYIVPMTCSHKQVLLQSGVPSNKILIFSEEISDPFGGSLEVYKKCAEQLKYNIEKLIGELND